MRRRPFQKFVGEYLFAVRRIARVVLVFVGKMAWEEEE